MYRILAIGCFLTQICVADILDGIQEIQAKIQEKELLYEAMQIDPSTIDDMPYFYWYRGTIDGLQLALDLLENEK